MGLGRRETARKDEEGQRERRKEFHRFEKEIRESVTFSALKTKENIHFLTFFSHFVQAPSLALPCRTKDISQEIRKRAAT